MRRVAAQLFLILALTGSASTLAVVPEVAIAQGGSVAGEAATAGTGSENTPAGASGATNSCWPALSVIPDLGCIWRSFMSFIGMIPASIGAWTLTVSGLLFNWLVEHTVIQFGSLYEAVKEGVEIAWTVFRDIANIIIIGMFAFIAISIILGNHDYGQKKMVARVLIVAILINFSLLFTKIIVDGSNFVALQFYRAAGLEQGAAAGNFNVSDTSQATYAGIAGRFIQHMGLTTAGDAYEAVNRFAENQQSGWLALLYGIFVGTLLLAAALVLLYGSFLLVSRAILIIFLMITASLAFASYLIPSLSEGSYGWSAWWKSLINTAVFAPLLMMFLWATLAVSEGLEAGSGATLGKLVTDPTNSNYISALFSYVIILGLLFASFKISSSFAGKISGFNFAAMIPALGAGLAFRGAGFLAQQTVGRGGTALGERFAARATRAQNDKKQFRAGMFDMAARSFKMAGKRDFNAANSAFGKQIAGIAGLKGSLAGQTKGKGFEGWEKSLKEAATAKADRLSYSKDEIAKMQKEALKSSTSAVAAEVSKVTGKDVAGVTADTLRQSVEEMAESQKKTKDDLIKAENSLKEAQKTLSTERNMGASDTSGAEARVNQHAEEVARHQASLDEQQARIEQARKLMGDIEHAAQSSLPSNVSLGKDAGALAKELKYKNAETIALNRLTNLPWVAGGRKAADDRIASKMRKSVDDAEHHKNMKKAMETWKHLTEEHEGGHKPSEKHVEKAVKQAQKTDDHGGGGHGGDDHSHS